MRSMVVGACGAEASCEGAAPSTAFAADPFPDSRGRDKETE